MIGKTNATTIIGGTTQGSLLVRYWDIDGTILKEQYINSGENATPPTNPLYDSELTFAGWNQSSTGLTYPADIGATYTCPYLTFYISITGASGYQPSIRVVKRDTTLLTIEWGDGTTSTSTSSGDITITKASPYSTYGTYKIRLVSGVDTIYNAGYYTYFNNSVYDKYITKMYIGNNVYKLDYGCISQSYHFNLQVLGYYPTKSVTLHPIQTQGLTSLKAIIIPNNVYASTNLGISSNDNVKVVSLPNNGSAFANNSFSALGLCTRMIFPPNNTYNTTHNVQQSYSLEYVWMWTTTVINNYMFSSCPNLRIVDNFNFNTITSIGAYAFNQTAISLPNRTLNLSNCTSVPAGFIGNTYTIDFVTLPTSTTVTAIPYGWSRDNYIKEIILSENSVSLGGYSLYTLRFCKKMDLQFITSVSANAIGGTLTALETIIFRSTTVPTFAAGSISDLNAKTRIYVPDAQLSDYKTALSSYSSVICPLSQLPA